MIGAARVPRQRAFLRDRAGRKGKHERPRRVVCDIARHFVVFLVDMAVEDGHVLPSGKNLDSARAVLRRPVPLGVEIEEGPVGKDDERNLGR
jgi:hypothetical protein